MLVVFGFSCHQIAALVDCKYCECMSRIPRIFLLVCSGPLRAQNMIVLIPHSRTENVTCILLGCENIQFTRERFKLLRISLH